MLDLQNLNNEKKRLRNFIDSRLQSHFDKDLVDFSKRVRLEADLEKWRTETIDMHAQATGKAARWYSIYFDNEFVCSFSADRTPGEVELLFLNNISKLFDKEEIFFDQYEYIIREEARKAKEREAAEKIKKEADNAPLEVKKVLKDLEKDESA